MTSVNNEEPPPVPKRICLQTSNPMSDTLDPDNVFKDKPLKMDAKLNQFSAEMDIDADASHGSMSVNASNNNDDLETSSISRNLFSEMPLENGTGMTHDLEYLMSSTEENKEISPKTSFDSPSATLTRNGDVLFESLDDDSTETVMISCHPTESLGVVLGMNEIIDASEGDVRKVYVKKISTSGAISRAMDESNSIGLGDEVLAINGIYIKNLSRTECLNLLIDLPKEITMLLLRNKLPWTTGPRCSFYLNLVDKNPESILSPAPKLFTNEGKKIPDGYKLLEISLYKEASDLLGISIVPTYGDTKHYYQIKELEPDGICSKSKLLNKGDCLVSCNGNSLHKIPFNQCLNILKSEGPSLTFEVFRKDDNQTVLEPLETQPIYDDHSEVNNNNNNNNNNDDDDGRSTNTFTSELLIPSEIKLTENVKPLSETNNQENLLDLTNSCNSDSAIFPDIVDFKASPDILDYKPSPDILDCEASPDISDSTDISKSHLSSFQCEVKNTLSKPLLDFLTGSPFTEPADNFSSDGLQKPIEACPAEPSTPPVVDETCIQLTAEAVESSPRTDWSSQSNMSEQSPANEAFSLDGLEEFSNTVINNANELNNNFNTGYPCSSNEDLISIDTDALSPSISNPTLIFYNHADPWEAAGEAKSENFPMSRSTNRKNVLNEFIDTVESPDYGSDPLDALQENIMQVTHDEKCLSQPTKFGADVSKGLSLDPSSVNVSLDNDLVEEERTSPISYDDSLSGSIGIHTADEGDIPLSSRNSDNDLIEDIPESPDSGRADSPGVYKNHSYDQEKFNQKEIILKFPRPLISEDHDKMTDEEASVYHTISDISRKNKGSENHGSFDSSESCTTSVGSFESCAETGEQDHFGNNSKHFTNKNLEASMSNTKSLPRNAFSYFKEYQSSNEKSATLRPDTKLFSFNQIHASNLKSDPNYSKGEYIKKFSDNLFSRNYRLERKSDQVRTEDKPFQVEVLKGIIGLGMTLKVDDQGGFVKVTHIQNNSPIGRNGSIKVGDYILAINNTDIVGESDSRVQQILRLLPRGLIKVVASAVPISDWKQYTEDAEKPSVGNPGTSHVPVSLTSPIKMPDSFSLNLSGRCLTAKATPEWKPSLSFSSALNVFAKDSSADSVKLSPTTGPSIPTSLHKNQFGFLNNSKQSPPLDNKVNKYNSSYEQSPLSSPEVVLSQVRMFENYSQKNNPNQEVREPVISSKQKLVEMFEAKNQKQFPEKDCKEALPDILQDHTNPLKKQVAQEVKNGTAKAIAKSYDAANKTSGSDNIDFWEEFIVPVKTNKYKTFSALPKGNTPRILDSYSVWDSMDSTMEIPNKVPQVTKKTVNPVNSVPKDAVNEEVIIPKKRTSVQSLVNRFNSPQNSNKPKSSEISYGSTVPKEFKAASEKAISELPRPAVVEETIEPIRKTQITNMSKPLPINFSELYDIDEVLIIEKTERKDSKPDLKMTLTGPYSSTVEVTEPLLKPVKKTEVKTVKKPVASPRKYILSPSRKPKEESSISEVKVSEPEVSIGIARRLPQSAVPGCIDIINIPEVVTTENIFHHLEEQIVPQVKARNFETCIESPRTKRAKAINLLGSMDDDTNYKSASATLQKLESKWFDGKEVDEEEIISCIKGVVSMSAKPRKIDNFEDVIVPVARKSQNSAARNYGQLQEDLPKHSVNVAGNEAKEIVKAVIKAAEKELSRTSVPGVKKPNTAICDIMGHTPWNEENDLPATICMNTATKYDTLEDNLTQIAEPELHAEIKSQKLSTQKRNLPLIENGRPKPMPRQSRQLSPSRETNTDIFGEKLKALDRSPPSPKLKSEIQPSALETNTDSQFSARLISPIPFQRSMSPTDDALSMSPNKKWIHCPEVSSVESPVCQQGTTPMEEIAKATATPVHATRTVSLFANRGDKVERSYSPVSFQPFSTSSAQDKKTECEAPVIMKSSLNLSSAVKTLPQEESKLRSASPVSTSSLSTDCLKNESPEMTIPTSPTRAEFLTKDVTDGLCASKRPVSLVTKPLDFEKETLTLSSPIKILSSSPVLPEVCEKSPLLASPVRLVSPPGNVTNNQASSPSASQSILHLETKRNDSAPTSPNHSPRRIGSTNRKLPDIFQSTHTFKTVSSPTKVRTFPEASTPNEGVLEHKFQKIKDVSNSEVALSRSISVEPKTASELKDPKLKTHIEIIENIPKAEVVVSQCINIEPTRASALSDVKVEQHSSVQVIEDVSKPEVAVSQFIGIKPTTATYLPEKKVKPHSAEVVEEIAKPEVAVSQFIGIKPTTASNLPSVTELKENKELSRPENKPTVNLRSVKKSEQNIEVLAGVPSPKAEVAVSRFIGLQPTTATGLSDPVKGSVSPDVQKDRGKQSPLSKAKTISPTRPDIVSSAESGRPAFLRHKSADVQLRNNRSLTEDNISTFHGEKTTMRRRMEKARPKTEIFSKEMPSIFSKRKWCISTKSGQTNFALPSEPETIERVVQLALIDEEDLDHLLTSANFALDKMGFANNEEIHIAILEKDSTEKIGIRLKKGEKQELVISLLETDGAAIKQKFIHSGDSLLLVNGKPAWSQTVMDVKVWLQTIETRIILVLCRHPMDEEEAANDCEYMDVILRKGVTGVGFCLEGGVGCPLGDRPISVKRIFKGGPAEKGGQLLVGDEILKVNDVDFRKQRHFVAWNHLKFLPEGDVKLHICRRKSHTAGTKAAAKLQAANNDSGAADISA